jgi:hypothetical protein
MEINTWWFSHDCLPTGHQIHHIKLSSDVDDEIVVVHEEKAAAQHNFYSNLLGCERAISWGFNLGMLYRNARVVDGPALVALFEPAEIKAAIFGMNQTSASGPDGLGPSFHRAAWPTVAPSMLRLFVAVRDRNANLGAINRAHVVLLPKANGILAPGSYKMVSLQNCSAKALCKALTSRLQNQIGALVNDNQSGFLSGRSISENFVFATELVQCCYNRKMPTVVLKLDFSKAFDSINWESLDMIMLARGFPHIWCDWMRMILGSSKSAILLNGIPERWIDCKRGLRQGDPLSPDRFLLVRMCCSR